ncbi:AEC family transporter, partial [Acetobacter pasteurianus]|nr:AEC family transporter [Acetobacter pasteurianus]
KQFLAFMNPPLYAMLISVIVASTPLQQVFFDTTGNNGNGSFIHNTFTNAITNLGSVSIPLILIVLGSNLYPSQDIPAASKHYNRMLIGSLVSRMILPPIILLPIIAMCVKYINTSILDDPIFLIVAFVLTVSPPAIQLSQISQLNGIYQKEMAGVLFWGYVILTLPTTIFIVVFSLKVLDWSQL